MNQHKDTNNHYNPSDLLKVYTYYRTLLSILLLVMFVLGIAPNVLGAYNPSIFLFAASSYTLFNIVTWIVQLQLKNPPSQKLLFSLFVVEVSAIVVLAHSSNLVPNGLAYLLLVSAAAGGMLLRGRIATFLAAVTSLAVIGETLYSALTGQLENSGTALFSAGILGGLIFISSLTFQYLTRKILTSTEEVYTRRTEVAKLQHLAQQIVERMRTGIMVLDANNNITMFNNAASKLLGLGNNRNPSLDGSPELKEKVETWQKAGTNLSPILNADSDTHDEVKVNFARLAPGNDTNTLIFLEDNRAITQQAQQLKLASLGRLTASIAHEIRNPLSAISHASQLLSEDSNLPIADKRLVEIIHSHTKRVNQIIENVLQLSRRRMSNPQTIVLDEWLHKFINDYTASKSPSQRPLIDCIATEPTVAKFDIGQLQQVLTNLCDNGIRYSNPPENCPHLVLESGTDSATQQPYIKVLDFGEGVSKEHLPHLFEPFFTTENTGSGLGLYICKELCEANQALITYSHTADGLSCFHIQLAHPDKTL